MRANFPLRTVLLSLTIGLSLSIQLVAADRTTLLIPLAADAETAAFSERAFPDDSFGKSAGHAWRAYLRVWKAHHDDPSNAAIRRFLGLSPDRAFVAQIETGRTAPRWLGWSARKYAKVETQHFLIYTRAGREQSLRVAEDLERCFWTWTQMFFPLWESQARVGAALADLGPDQTVQGFLAENSARISSRRKLRIALCRDVAEYRETVKVPGIERSTGYYGNDKRTTFLYASDVDDAATRRHELVHQLFREATRSSLGEKLPGEKSDFWLIEGIAGYFESMYVGADFATVGGWDSPRLQYARYRVLAGGDQFPLAELRRDGRLDAQSRADIARWYTHAIAQTHRLMDGGNSDERRWIYDRLAEQYQLRLAGVGSDDRAASPTDSLAKFLSIDDAIILQNPIHRALDHLSLPRCRVTNNGLLTLDSSSLEQLTLEATQIDSGLASWLKAAPDLYELDLSGTPTDDSVLDAIKGAKKLSTLWMTGTNVSDKSIDVLQNMPGLKRVDLQRTKVTADGIARLRASRPALEVNLLELVEPK